MKYFFCLVIFIASSALAQNAAFEKFAGKQDSLCNLAYEKRDDKKYVKLLDEYEKKYNKLGDDKMIFANQRRNLYYNLCCTYSLQGNKQKALDVFEQCIKMGYADYAHTVEDTDLDNIRKEERYKALATQLRRVADYPYILKQAEKYNDADARPIPKFTYQSADNENLQTLRKNFNLDSIAGEGNDATRIISLMHWIHNLVPHDGQHENPVVKNAMSMIAQCKKEKRGLNCRGLATVLNECYLSLGYASRFLTCLPKDSLHTDSDCHVINMVYCPSLKKWIWIDPTNDAYVMNEKGELLGPQEVRERLIHDKPLVVNPDANWNHKQAVVKENYLDQYMAKNLYMFSCNINSQYDSETGKEGKKVEHVELLPLDYFVQKPDMVEETKPLSKTVYVTYKTNNPGWFWQAPK